MGQRVLGATSGARPDRLLGTLRHRRGLEIEHQERHRHREHAVAQRRESIEAAAREPVVASWHPPPGSYSRVRRQDPATAQRRNPGERTLLAYADRLSRVASRSRTAGHSLSRIEKYT